MNTKFHHLTTLIGRVFLISQPYALINWEGANEKANGEMDYDLLDGYISNDEGDLTLFNKDDNSFYIYFSMSSKIELFKSENAVLICDGLYFNHSLDHLNDISVREIEELEFKVNVFDGSLTIFDASLDVKNIVTEGDKGHNVNLNNNFISVNLVKGIYNAKRIEVDTFFNDEIVSLKGIGILCI